MTIVRFVNRHKVKFLWACGALPRPQRRFETTDIAERYGLAAGASIQVSIIKPPGRREMMEPPAIIPHIGTVNRFPYVK